MIKIISEKEYETMKRIIDKQNDQIDRLLKLTVNAQMQTKTAISYCVDFIKVINDNVQSLPPEANELVRKVMQFIGNEG